MNIRVRLKHTCTPTSNLPGGGWSHQHADWQGFRPSGSGACPHGEWVWRPCPPCRHEASPSIPHGRACLRETGNHR